MAHCSFSPKSAEGWHIYLYPRGFHRFTTTSQEVYTCFVYIARFKITCLLLVYEARLLIYRITHNRESTKVSVHASILFDPGYSTVLQIRSERRKETRDCSPVDEVDQHCRFFDDAIVFYQRTYKTPHVCSIFI
jgi:hypothetical protein